MQFHARLGGIRQRATAPFRGRGVPPVQRCAPLPASLLRRGCARSGDIGWLRQRSGLASAPPFRQRTAPASLCFGRAGAESQDCAVAQSALDVPVLVLGRADATTLARPAGRLVRPDPSPAHSWKLSRELAWGTPTVVAPKAEQLARTANGLAADLGPNSTPQLHTR